MNSYFLAAIRFLWMLGVSDASGMFDILNYCLFTLFLFMFLKAYFFHGSGDIQSDISDVFLSIWLRKSKVMTGAQWIETRFTVPALEPDSLISVLWFFGIGKCNRFIGLCFQRNWKLQQFSFHGICLQMFTIDPYVAHWIYAQKEECSALLYWSRLMSPHSLLPYHWTYWRSIQLLPDEYIKHPKRMDKSSSIDWDLDLDWTRNYWFSNTNIVSDGYGIFGILLSDVGVPRNPKGAAGHKLRYAAGTAHAISKERQQKWMVLLISYYSSRYMMISGITVPSVGHFTSVKTDGTKSRFKWSFIYY